MDIQKIHLDRSKKGSITCPNCGKTKAVNALPFKTNQPIKVRCKCEHQHEIQFEQRLHNRRPVKIKGRLEKNNAHSLIAKEIQINNISLGGIQFTVDDLSGLTANDEVQLFFVINAVSQSQLRVTGVLRYFRGNHVGVEFGNLDKHTLALIQQYTRDPAESKRAQEPILSQKIRHQDEALCISAVQRDLKQFFSSARSAPAINFAGNTWDDALRRFRLAWGTRHICNRCHNVTDSESAVRSQYRCRSCNEGSYTANPKELWDIILSNGPNREKYLGFNEAISATRMTTPEFTKIYEYGFLVPVRSHLYDNTLIGTLRSAMEQSRSLGIDLSVENIGIPRSKNKIRIIRKRNYDDDPGKITIGRSEMNDIVFYGSHISRVHACLYVDSGNKGCHLADLDSSNGTFLNKRRLPPTQLYEIRNNDIIVLGGEVTLVYFSSVAFHRWLNTLAHGHDERVQSEE